MRSNRLAAAALIACAGTVPAAHAEVKISTAATSNMACSDGVCAPAAKDAVLNAGDLETLLASGNVEVTTTGSGVQAKDIRIDGALSWSSTNTLALDAYRSILVEKQVSITGRSGLAATTNDGGSDGMLLFLGKGRVTFANLSSSLAINGTSYSLVNTLPTLAGAIAANPAGAYALANSYDASQDGDYSNAPIPTTFTGSFNGLGNTISDLTVDDQGEFDDIGDALFSWIGTGGTVACISVVNASITGAQNYVAGLAGTNQGEIENTFVSGSLIQSPNNSTWAPGGLVSWNFGGTVMFSHTDVKVTVDSAQNGAAGLVAASSGTIVQSYATGSVSVGEQGYGGGLVASNGGSIEQSYADVKVSGQYDATIGGLIGSNGSTVAQAYSTGAIRDRLDKHRQGYKGGFVGDDSAPAGSITYGYWDTATSHVRNGARGAGHPKNDPGITGLTTQQLQSGLPKGFDPTVWAENPKINNSGGRFCLDRDSPWISGFSTGCSKLISSRRAGRA